MVLDNPWPLALKAAFASMLAYLLCVALDLPDGVSAAFVAVVCVTPTVLAGLRRAVGQTIGSILGGVLAAIAMTLELPTAPSLGVSVGLSVFFVYLFRFPGAVTVAAFTAIYVHLLPLGAPGHTLWVRIAAVLVGAGAAMTVNTMASAMFYERIFARRFKRVVASTAARLERLAAGELEAMVPVFATLGSLSWELQQATTELRWRTTSVTAESVDRRRRQVRALIRVAHFAHDLASTVDEADSALTQTDRDLLVHTAHVLRGHAGNPPTNLGEVGTRLLATLQRYESVRNDDTSGS